MPLDSNELEFGNHIPAAVRRASERADEIAREVGVANVPPAEGGETAVEPATTVVPEPVVVPPAAPPAAAEPNYEQQYRTLQGKYDSEVPTLRAQVQSMERLLATMNTPPARVDPPVVEPPSTTVVHGATPKDLEDFGEDLIQAALRWVQPALAKIEARAAALEAQLGIVKTSQQQTTTLTARQTAMLALDNDTELGAPTANGTKANDGRAELWRVVNDDTSFHAWLNQADPISGQHRLKLLRDAFDAGNVSRMKATFKAFIAEHTAVNTAPPPATTHTPTQGTGGPTLESLVAPGRTSGPAPAGAPADKRVWTQAAIQAFYRDVQRGAFNDDPAGKLAMERDLFAAMAEGRIR